MTQLTPTTVVRERGPAFWLAVVATASLVVLYLGSLFESLGMTGAADTWADLLAIGSGAVTLATVLAWVFWLSAIALAVVLFAGRREPGAADVEIEAPAFARFLFSNSRAGLLWLPIRVFLAFAWLDAGLHKIVDPAWRDGTALGAFWERIVQIPDEGRPAITYEWYRDFIQALLDAGAESWFTWLVMIGEIAVGLGLLFGLLTGIAAFAGALLNMSFMLAGSASTNPVLFALAISVILAWRVAGYYGLDRYLLPRLGTPWRPGPPWVARAVSPERWGGLAGADGTERLVRHRPHRADVRDDRVQDRPVVGELAWLEHHVLGAHEARNLRQLEESGCGRERDVGHDVLPDQLDEGREGLQPRVADFVDRRGEDLLLAPRAVIVAGRVAGACVRQGGLAVKRSLALLETQALLREVHARIDQRLL